MNVAHRIHVDIPHLPLSSAVDILVIPDGRFSIISPIRMYCNYDMSLERLRLVGAATSLIPAPLVS